MESEIMTHSPRVSRRSLSARPRFTDAATFAALFVALASSLISTVVAAPPRQRVVWNAAGISFLRDGVTNTSLKASGTAAPDGSAFSLLFTGLKTETTGPARKSYSKSYEAHHFTAVIPHAPVTGQTITGYQTDLRGFVATDADTRVVLAADLNGTLYTQEFPFGKPVRGQELRFSLRSPNVLATDATKKAYVANIWILIQRRTPRAGQATVTVDSLDIVPQLLPGGSEKAPVAAH